MYECERRKKVETSTYEQLTKKNIFNPKRFQLIT